MLIQRVAWVPARRDFPVVTRMPARATYRGVPLVACPPVLPCQSGWEATGKLLLAHATHHCSFDRSLAVNEGLIDLFVPLGHRGVGEPDLGVLATVLGPADNTYTEFLPAGFLGAVEICIESVDGLGITSTQACCTAIFGGPNDDCVNATAVAEGLFPFVNFGANLDGPIDCADSDCFGDPACLYTELICDDGYDFVMGSRFLAGGGYGGEMPAYRKFATRLHPFLVGLFCGKKITESTNGFRAMRLSVLDDERIDLHQSWLDHYELEVYLLMKLMLLGYKTTEIPATKIYPKKALGQTKMRPGLDWWRIMRPIFLLGLRLKH